MAKNITSVSWEASNLPSGLSFDTATGTFSGTPSGEGEYTVPVSVRTNYGTDTKDVNIKAVKAYPVYAIGGMAATWSENAEPDANGFRKLNMPNAYWLQSLYKGFSAQTSLSGDWYLGSSLSDGNAYGVPNESFLIPRKYPVEGIAEMIGAYDTSSEDSFFCYAKKNDRGTYHYKNGALERTSITVMLSKDFTSSDYARIYKNTDGVLRLRGYGFLSSILECDKEDIKKIGGTSGQGVSTGNFLVLKKNGELLIFDISKTDGYSLNFALAPFQNEEGKITGVKNFWFGDWWSTFFILLENNKLYARGANGNSQIGLSSEINTSPAYVYEVGTFNVKKICQPFLLTEDGELYHTGDFKKTNRFYVDGIPSHTEFTRIFPEYVFDDIAFPYGANTLLVTIKE